MDPCLLSHKEVELIKEKLVFWEITEIKMERKFIFKDFKQAFGFIAQVALAAEQLNHHPDWQNSYNRVIIKLSTHDLGGISKLDIKLAEDIESIIKKA